MENLNIDTVSYPNKSIQTDSIVSLSKKISKLEKDLVRAQHFQQRLLETIVSAVLVADSSGTITLANGVASQMFSNYAPLIGANVLEMLPFDQLLIEATPHNGSDSTLYGETSLDLFGKEQPIYVTFSISHVVDPNGEQEGLVCAFTDITTSKLLERQLLQSQKLEAVGQLAAGVAHEINTPIQYIRDNTMFFRDEFSRLKDIIYPIIEGLDNEDITNSKSDIDYAFDEIPNAIKETLQGIEAVADIVRSMKEFSHPGSMEMVETDLNKNIEATVSVCKNEWKYVADIVWDLDSNLEPVPCFPAEINQVLLNLLVNSAQAIEEKMGVTGCRYKGIITVRSKALEKSAIIEIVDTGNGIKQEIQDKVFEPFFTTKAQGKGTGQGLSLAYSCIEQKHKGKLSFESKAGEGTTFRIELPYAVKDL